MAMEASEKIRTRRVQRLGTSSLVVTLPKEWVRRVGLKPGDMVMIVIEGNSVRVIPAGAGEVGGVLEVDASKLPVGVSKLISCAYVMRVDAVRVRGLDWRGALEARSAASRLMGVDVASTGDGVEVRMILDDTRVTVEEILEGVVQLAVELIGLVEKLIEEPSQQLVQLAREAYNEIVKYEHLAVRKLTGSIPGPEQARVYAAAILGDVAADLWTLANMLASLVETRGRVEAGEAAKKLLGGMAKLLERIPKARELDELAALAKEAEALRMDAYRATLDAEKPTDAAIAATLHHAARYLTAALDTLLCNKLMKR